jgi:hypothetical protein
VNIATMESLVGMGAFWSRRAATLYLSPTDSETLRDRSRMQLQRTEACRVRIDVDSQ